ncbi:MAG: hypothetical protein CM15mP34_2300 [Gammaproteobacteria bacterium]|nr:MAG: hypothetical protein CM15mP34_2300 [Gammaproteobacteria bacterium]
MTQFFKNINYKFNNNLNFSNIASAETTMSAEGQYILKSLGFYLWWCIGCFFSRFLFLESGLVTTKKCINNCSQKYINFSICSLIFFYVAII